MNGNGCYPLNAIASLSIYCIYLMHSLHHILLDHYDYLMMQSCLWQMVRTRTTDDDVLDIPEGSARTWLWTALSWQCTAATPTFASQFVAATGNIE
jgi:hypothetical protein